MVVHCDCHVQHDRAFYSVSFALAGKTLWLRATDTAVAIQQVLRHVVTRLCAPKPGVHMTLREHLSSVAHSFFERDR